MSGAEAARPGAPTRRALIAGALACAGLGPAAGTPAAQPMTLRRGVNLWPWFALTREFPAPRTDYDWPPFQPGRPVPSRDDLRRLAEAGFDFVRLPVDPGPFLAFTGAARETLIGHLTEAVDEVLSADLRLVLNLQANAATHHYTPDNLYGGGAPLLGPFRDLLAEIARRLAGRAPGRIALEPVNEPPQACGAQGWDRIQHGLLAAARKAAPDITLVATGACGSMAAGLTALDPAPLRAYAPLLLTFHFYEPYLFTHQGAPWMTEPVYRALNGVPWPGSAGTLEETLASVRARMRADGATSPAAKQAAYATTEAKLREYFAAGPDRRYLDRHLGAVKSWAEIYGIPAGDILMGEFGALRSDARYVAARRADRVRYIRDVRESAEAFGFPWAFWNLFDGMGLMDDASRALDGEVIRALGLRMPPR
ncbi:glycoside hydrolase family 5 protein [Methylobacterium nigriterrae]|uniref:glycoside hydrolase family 5 protein n=1 Tax=Methylobacterium nigriterrae TaxID=3127512 RepID=UPI0030141A9C